MKASHARLSVTEFLQLLFVWNATPEVSDAPLWEEKYISEAPIRLQSRLMKSELVYEVKGQEVMENTATGNVRGNVKC